MKSLTLSLLLVLALPRVLAAQDTAATLWTREIVNSTKLKESRSILVALPDDYRTSTERYPVLVLLDADDQPQFRLAIANVAFLASRRAIPPLIVVGIPNGKDRTHDLTPPATGGNAKRFPSAGGADAFADFIVDEVLPRVRSKYRTMPSAILAGHSFGGLVALEVAAKKPGVFIGVIAMSPSLWWNDSSGVTTYADAIAKANKGERLFVTSGGLEGDIDRPTVRLSRILDSLKLSQTAFGHRRYPEDSHGLTPAPSLADGIRFVFEPISVAALPNTYDSLGDALLAAGDTTAAVTQFRRAVDVGTRMKQPVFEDSMKKLKAIEDAQAKAKGGKSD